MRRFALLLLATTGCADGFDAPTCATGELRIEGTLDRIPIDVQRTLTGYVFVNAGFGTDTNGSVELQVGDDRLVIEFPDLLANGEGGPARGTVNLSGLTAGNCEVQGFPSELRLDSDGNGGQFLLRSLAMPACGTPASGELAGCYRQP
jgi:hypothetical protein